ncbi:hypothetical protein B296_00032426, partial [Ensete ventricosum]
TAEIDRRRPILVVPPDSGRSAAGPVCTRRYGSYRSGEEIARERRATSDSRFFFSLFFFSLFFFLPPSADTARNRPVTVEIDRYRSISDGNKVKTATIGDTA